MPDTPMQSFIIANISHYNSETNVIGRLSKKHLNNEDPIFLMHYKRAKDSSFSPIVPCDGYPLSILKSQIANLKT